MIALIISLVYVFMTFTGYIQYLLWSIVEFVMNFPIMVLEGRYFLMCLPHAVRTYIIAALDFLRALSPMDRFVSWLTCAPPETLFYFFEWPQSRYCFLVNRINGTPAVISNFDCYLFLIVLVIIISLIYLYQGVSVKIRVQEFWMNMLVPFGVAPSVQPGVIRRRFHSHPLIPPHVNPNHTHAGSAAGRAQASAFIDSFGPAIGLTPYFVQRSRNDEIRGRLGSRVPFWAKDLNTVPTDFSPPDRPLLAMVDVDYYLDMPSFLCDNFSPTILYTFQPDQVAKVAAEYSYTFDSQNRVVYKVSGGGSYTHRVWNYSTDNVVVWKSFFGIPYKFACYLVDRKNVQPDHEVVLFTPLALWTGLFAPLVRLFLSGAPLAYLDVVRGRFLRLYVVRQDGGIDISTGQVENYLSATLPADSDEAVATIARSSKYEFTLPQATSFTNGDKVAGAVLMDFHRAQPLVEKPPVVCPVSEAVRAYQFNPRTYCPADKPLVKPFMSPLLNDCFTPTNSLSSEETAVQERVLKPKPPILPSTPFISLCMKEFVEFLIPDPHQLDPVDFDYLLDHQSRPSQRRMIEVSQGVTPKRVVQSFLKKESYGEVKAPRVISTINTVDKSNYSLFIYALVEGVLKKQAWYAFGKTPRDVAQRVAEICQKALSHVANSDFHKFDGHGSNLMRDLEAMIHLRAFRAEHHDSILELHQSQYSLPAYTTSGVFYETDYTRLSGSAETSCFNSMVNAFVAYMEKRMVKVDGSSREPRQAWDELGIYGGDDGVTADVDKESYIRAAAMIGQDLEVELIYKHTLGVKFLARVYSPYVWQGDVNTCCDLPRQLSKLHVTVNLPPNVTPAMKLLEKCRAFYATDRNTPILGPFVVRARELIQSDFVADPLCAQMRPWNSELPPEKQYVNDPHEWLQEYAASALPDANISAFSKWLANTKTITDLLTPPLLQAPTPARSSLPVVIDGEELPRTKLTAQRKSPEEKKAEFERLKAEKIRAGTWKERQPLHTDKAPPVETPEVPKGAVGPAKEKPRFDKSKHKKPDPTVKQHLVNKVIIPECDPSLTLPFDKTKAAHEAWSNKDKPFMFGANPFQWSSGSPDSSLSPTGDDNRVKSVKGGASPVHEATTIG
jgi:hypothetical protein